jgi:hypothetical protein
MVCLLGCKGRMLTCLLLNGRLSRLRLSTHLLTIAWPVCSYAGSEFVHQSSRCVSAKRNFLCAVGSGKQQAVFGSLDAFACCRLG